MLNEKRQCEQCGKKRDASRFTPKGKKCDLCLKANKREVARRRHLWNAYGLTLEEYEQMAAGGCNVCGGSRPYNLAVDHDHAVAEQYGLRESVRGAVCKRCNKVLRDVRDSPELLMALAQYLLNPPAKKVLYP